MRYDSVLHIGPREISITAPTYFIADIAANHDGDLNRAKDLIFRARDAGADAVKFQHFKADKIVSDRGFRDLGSQLGHQAAWKKPVFEIYRQYECNRDWNLALAETACAAEIDFMTTPYDVEAVEMLDAHVPAYKIGSGDITWSEFLGYIARRGKPVILATGAADMIDVERAVDAVLAETKQFALLQCNTNYTGSLENFHHVNLRVLAAYALHYPGMVLGLSDHTPGHAAALGAIALGARIIEKHFTDDPTRVGPDHSFSMTPTTWREMVDRGRELETALGDGVKRVEANERETVVLQRRCLRLARDLSRGSVLSDADLEALRPAPAGALEPHRQAALIGARLTRDMQRGEALHATDVEGLSC
jgi:sialic acid synthase SpsE